MKWVGSSDMLLIRETTAHVLGTPQGSLHVQNPITWRVSLAYKMTTHLILLHPPSTVPRCKCWEGLPQGLLLLFMPVFPLPTSSIFQCATHFLVFWGYISVSSAFSFFFFSPSALMIASLIDSWNYCSPKIQPFLLLALSICHISACSGRWVLWCSPEKWHFFLQIK